MSEHVESADGHDAERVIDSEKEEPRVVGGCLQARSLVLVLGGLLCARRYTAAGVRPELSSWRMPRAASANTVAGPVVVADCMVDELGSRTESIREWLGLP